MRRYKLTILNMVSKVVSVVLSASMLVTSWTLVLFGLVLSGLSTTAITNQPRPLLRILLNRWALLTGSSAIAIIRYSPSFINTHCWWRTEKRSALNQISKISWHEVSRKWASKLSVYASRRYWYVTTFIDLMSDSHFDARASRVVQWYEMRWWVHKLSQDLPWLVTGEANTSRWRRHRLSSFLFKPTFLLLSFCS